MLFSVKQKTNAEQHSRCCSAFVFCFNRFMLVILFHMPHLCIFTDNTTLLAKSYSVNKA